MNRRITLYDVNVVITKQGDARIKEVIFGADERT